MATALLELEEMSPPVIHITELSGTDSAVAATNMDNVRHGATTVYGILVENGVAAVEYLRLYDNVAPTIGTTEPDHIFEIPASETAWIPLNGVSGISFTNGLSLSAGAATGKGNTNPPAGAVNVTLMCST